MTGTGDVDKSQFKAALIVNQFPLPPRNGITIPSSQILHWMLLRGYFVDIWLLTEEGMESDFSQLKSDRVRVIKPSASRVNVLKKCFHEITGNANAFNQLNVLTPSDLDVNSYLITVSTPISVGQFAPRFLRSEKHIVAINDSYYAVLRTYPFKNRWVAALNRVRAPFIRRAEHSALKRFDGVLVQTKADLDWLVGKSVSELKGCIHPLHNAVPDVLIDLPYTGDQGVPRLLFVGDMANALYQKNIMKFYEIWKKIRVRVPNAVFQIAGSGLSPSTELAKRLAADSSVQVLGFVPDICEVYRGVRVVVALIDKPYGFMNKVAEAIASGIPVVGDSYAFNGISMVLKKGGGVEVRSAESFEHEIVSLLTDDIRVRHMSSICKLVAREELSLQSFCNSLDRILDPSSARQP